MGDNHLSHVFFVKFWGIRPKSPWKKGKSKERDDEAVDFYGVPSFKPKCWEPMEKYEKDIDIMGYSPPERGMHFCWT